MNLKNLPAIVLALVLTLAFANVAVAESATTYYTITGPADGHEYYVYQIFTGDQDGNTLSNVKWGKNGTGTVGEPVPEYILNALQELTDNTQATADEISQYVVMHTHQPGPFAILTDRENTVSVPAGYYLVEDHSGAYHDAWSTYIVFIANDITLAPKKAVPSFEKKLIDTNDTTGETTGWQDSADYDIGDTIPFKMTGTVASNYDSYKNYRYYFDDSMDKGLTFNADSLVVKIDGKTVSKDQYDFRAYDHGFDVDFTDLKKVKPVASAGSIITVEYTATLNEDAYLGERGNINSAFLICSLNPNKTYLNWGEAGRDDVIVFTYKVVVNKVDPDNQPLAGAAFTLLKKVNDEWKTVDKIEADDDVTSFTFTGLDDGDYQLVETTTPAGYNSIDPIAFTIDAEHKTTWNPYSEGRWEEGEDPWRALISLTGKTIDGSAQIFSATEYMEALSTDIVNNKGAELPTTGGIGVTIFYVAGAIAALGAVIVAVSKKRMSSET